MSDLLQFKSIFKSTLLCYLKGNERGIRIKEYASYLENHYLHQHDQIQWCWPWGSFWMTQALFYKAKEPNFFSSF